MDVERSDKDFSSARWLACRTSSSNLPSRGQRWKQASRSKCRSPLGILGKYISKDWWTQSLLRCIRLERSNGFVVSSSKLPQFVRLSSSSFGALETKVSWMISRESDTGCLAARCTYKVQIPALVRRFFSRVERQNPQL